MTAHPYKTMPGSAFWKRSVANAWDVSALVTRNDFLLRKGEKIASAGSCFAANIVPFLENAGFDYVRAGVYPPQFEGFRRGENFSYSKFSAAYGNVYTVRQAVQILKRALDEFRPAEDRWPQPDGTIVDPFRPGLKYRASSDLEFDLLTQDYLANVLTAFRRADVFIFTLGLTEAWVSKDDGAVFPACPGTVAGEFDPTRHVFRNFSVSEVAADLDEFLGVAREINPGIRFILTVSPVPLVATATSEHVLVASIYSKSVLRAVAGEAAQRHAGVTYFPAYEIVAGPQAPPDYFEPDRREPTRKAIGSVMRCFLSHCEGEIELPEDDSAEARSRITIATDERARDQIAIATDEKSGSDVARASLSAAIAAALCEEAASEL